MGNPVVHFEVSGQNPQQLREYFGALFGWEYDVDSPVAPAISDTGNYGFIEPTESGIPGGVGGGPSHPRQSLFYVGVPDVGQAFAKAVELGGQAVLEPQANPAGHLVVAHFRDPEGNLIGLAGPK